MAKTSEDRLDLKKKKRGGGGMEGGGKIFFLPIRTRILWFLVLVFEAQ